MSLRLSPLNLSGLIACQREEAMSLVRQVKDKTSRRPITKDRQSAIRVSMWECPICGDRFDDDDEAEECCQGASEEAQAEAAKLQCPVCMSGFEDHYQAADCCLWKDIPAPERWKIAAAVEAGKTWAEALGVEFVGSNA